MKSKITLFILCTFMLLIISGCGQSDNKVQPSNGADHIESDHNDDLADPNNGNDSNLSEDNEHPVNLYFTDKDVANIYSEEIIVNGEGEDVFQSTIEAWINGPSHEELTSLIPKTVKVQSIEEIDGVAHISFSPEFLETNVGSGSEAMLLQQIALIMKQFGFNSTQILIDGEIKDELFGHVDTSEPIEATDPTDIEKIK